MKLFLKNVTTIPQHHGQTGDMPWHYSA